MFAAASRPVTPARHRTRPNVAAAARISSGLSSATATTSVNTVATEMPAALSPFADAETTHSVTPAGQRDHAEQRNG